MAEEDTTPTDESTDADITGDFLALSERAVRNDGVVNLKVIQPGWGSSGYYSAPMLERDGPQVFTRGTHMYWNHPTLTEDAARPERDLRDLAAVLVSDAKWQSNGPSGAGLYAQAKVFGGYQKAVEEMAPHIGVSIRAMGKGSLGEAEGRKGRIIEGLVSAQSVDFVTAPGAGGQILSLFESARERTSTSNVQEGQMDNQELTEARTALAERDTQLAEALARVDELTKAQEAQATELARFREAHIVNTARTKATEGVAKANLPDVTKARIVESVASNPPVTDGALDETALANRIAEALKAEAEYLSRVGASGRITGMGSAGEGNGNLEEAQKEFGAALGSAWGLDEAGVKVAVAGRG